MSGDYLRDDYSLPCPGPPVSVKPDPVMSPKTVKVRVDFMYI